MWKVLAGVVVGVVTLIGGVFFGRDTLPQFGAANTTVLVGGTTYNLSGSGVSSSATSITLASLTLPQNGYKIQDSDLSATFYLTLEPGNRTRQEFVSCTTVVQNAAGTATLSGCTRGLSPVTPFTASSTLQFAHAGGAQVIFSDPPQLFNDFYALGNVATSTNILVFSSTTPPRLDFVGVQANGTYIATTSEFASIAYVNAISVAGASNGTESVKGIWEGATALEQASSTILGGTGAGLLMQAQYATDTPQYGCAVGYTATAGAGCAIVADLTGKIKAAWLSAQTFTWSAAHTFSSTVNIAASSAARLTLNSIAYAFPPSTAASSSVMVSDGSNNLFWRTPMNTVLAASSTGAQTASAASTTISYVTIPANILGAPYKLMRITSLWSPTVFTNEVCWVSIGFGNGSATSTVGFNKIDTQKVVTLDVKGYATTTSSQGWFSTGTVPTAGSAVAGQYVAVTNVVAVQGFNYTTVDLTAQSYLSFIAQANGGSTCKLNAYIVEVLSQ